MSVSLKGVIMNFLDWLLGRLEGGNSRNTAKERLQATLLVDRTNITPALLQTLKDEIITCISKHVEIDQNGMELMLAQTLQYHRIVADIPVIRARDLPSASRSRRRKVKNRPPFPDLLPEGQGGIPS
jgi:cell division topological specificity factor